jgi:hypothetical protein
MATFGFGQQTGQIMQMAYVVQDIRAAMNWWLMDGKTGPWFLLESFTGPDQMYRGEQSLADVAIAMSFNGHMNIELIQPKDDHPSVYKETIEKKGYGFHHIGIAVDDTEAEASAYIARGFEEAFSADVPSGGRVRYVDDGVTEPGFIELIPATPGMDEMFTGIYEAARDWDGIEDPIRPF